MNVQSEKRNELLSPSSGGSSTRTTRRTKRRVGADVVSCSCRRKRSRGGGGGGGEFVFLFICLRHQHQLIRRPFRLRRLQLFLLEQEAKIGIGKALRIRKQRPLNEH